MIKAIVDLLNTHDWYDVSENVDIAKGKYKAPSNWKEAKNNIIRSKNGS